MWYCDESVGRYPDCFKTNFLCFVQSLIKDIEIRFRLNLFCVPIQVPDQPIRLFSSVTIIMKAAIKIPIKLYVLNVNLYCTDVSIIK